MLQRIPTGLLLLGLATVVAAADPAPAQSQHPAPPAVIAAPAAAGAAKPIPNARTSSAQDQLHQRFQIDGLLMRARAAKEKGDWATAESDMLEAARQLKLMGYEHDQVSVLREMTMERVEGQGEGASAYRNAGRKGMAEYYYYQYYLRIKPRDAQWLLEALAWANYAQADNLLKKFVARVPDKAHENIDARAVERARELERDDALYLAYGDLQKIASAEVPPGIRNWPYPVNSKHTELGTTLLHMAVWFNRPAVVKWLVEEKKADLNVTDKEQDTPLDYAEHQHYGDLVQYLKGKGAKANKQYGKPATVVNPPAKDGAKPAPPVVKKTTQP